MLETTSGQVSSMGRVWVGMAAWAILEHSVNLERLE